jgi:hypothetical protein
MLTKPLPLCSAGTDGEARRVLASSVCMLTKPLSLSLTKPLALQELMEKLGVSEPNAETFQGF